MYWADDSVLSSIQFKNIASLRGQVPDNLLPWWLAFVGGYEILQRESSTDVYTQSVFMQQKTVVAILSPEQYFLILVGVFSDRKSM